MSASAFGVTHVAKSEYQPGTYKPVTRMTPRKKAQTAQLAIRRSGDRGLRAMTGEPAAPTAAHSTADIYHRHGIGTTFTDLKRQFHTKTVPSTVHPNIHYNANTHPDFRHAVDRNLNPAATRRLRHPVVFHHAEISPIAVAAGAGAHVTTAHKGHVIVNTRHVSRDGTLTNPAPGVHLHEVLNHELAHAAVRTKNPRSLEGRKHPEKSGLGEEGRADAQGVPGRGLYEKTGVVPSRAAVEADKTPGLRAIRNAAKNAHMDLPRGDIMRARRNHQLLNAQNMHYHNVHAAVRAASKLRKSAFGVAT